jgi:hypothetical protein
MKMERVKLSFYNLVAAGITKLCKQNGLRPIIEAELNSKLAQQSVPLVQ